MLLCSGGGRPPRLTLQAPAAAPGAAGPGASADNGLLEALSPPRSASAWSKSPRAAFGWGPRGQVALVGLEDAQAGRRRGRGAWRGRGASIASAGTHRGGRERTDRPMRHGAPLAKCYFASSLKCPQKLPDQGTEPDFRGVNCHPGHRTLGPRTAAPGAGETAGETARVFLPGEARVTEP